MNKKFEWGEQSTLVNTKKYQTNIVTLDETKTTDYVKHSFADKYILILEGSGIVTINTVDFVVSTNQTMYIKFGSEHLYSNSSEENKLIVLETLVSEDLNQDTIDTIKSIN